MENIAKLIDQTYLKKEATEEELKKASFVKYDKTFGKVNTPKEAYIIAVKVLDEVYDNCSKKELPFKIKDNTIANAWIVSGTLPKMMLGGVGTIGIKKETGEVIYLIHTK